MSENCELPDIVDQEQFTTDLQNYYSRLSADNKKSEWTSKKIQNVIRLLDGYNIAKSQGKRPTDQQYYHAKKYDIKNVDNQKVLVLKRKKDSDPVVQIIPCEEYYQVLLDAHIATGHGRRDKIVHFLKDKHLIPVFAITTFLNLCKICISKRNRSAKKSLMKKKVVDPLSLDDPTRRGYINFVDLRNSPDGEYKWLLQYQDDWTKFCFLRPLKSKEAKEVAVEILKILLEVGCPHTLQSYNEHEFTASILKEIINMWPACEVVQGDPCSQSPENIESLNQDLKNVIWVWMAANQSTNWSLGCHFIQFQKNLSHHSSIATTPYKAMFREHSEVGHSSTDSSINIMIAEEEIESLTSLKREADTTINTKSKKSKDSSEDSPVLLKFSIVKTESQHSEI